MKRIIPFISVRLVFFAVCSLLLILTSGVGTRAQCVPPVLSASVTNLSCGVMNDGAVNLTVSGGNPPFTYSWSGVGSFSAASEDISGLIAGTYTVTVSGGGCSSDTTITILPASDLSVIAQANGATTFCPGDSVLLTASSPDSGVTFQWLMNGNISVSDSSFYSATQMGYYEVNVTRGGDCPDTSIPITVVVPMTPDVTVTPVGAAVICTDDTLTIAAIDDPAYVYQWLRNGVVLPGEDSALLFTSIPGNYRVVIDMGSGCPDTSNAVIASIQPLPVATISVLYVGGVQKIVATTPFAAYQWYHNDQILTDSTGQFITSLGTGSYYVIVTDANGCSDTSNVLTLGLNVNNTGNPISLQLFPNPFSDVLYVEASEAVQVSIRDMQGRELLTSTGVSRIPLSMLAAGTYLVIVSDKHGVPLLHRKLMKQ